MTIRDIFVRFGFNVDKRSTSEAEANIRGLKDKATQLLGALGIGFSLVALKGFVNDCTTLASNVSEMKSKFDTVFGDMSETVNDWADDFADSIGRSRSTIKTYLADQQNLLVGFTDGSDEAREASAKLAEEMTSLALDIASFANTDEDVAVDRMTKAVMGQAEAAKGLGAVLNNLTREEAMQRMGLTGTYEALDQYTKMTVNLNAIQYQSKDAIGDCINSLDRYESKTRQLAAKQKDFKEFVGTQLMPVMSGITSLQLMFAKGADKVAKAILGETEEDNRLLKVMDRTHALIKKMQPAIDRFTKMFSTGMKNAGEFIHKVADKLGGMDNLLGILTIAVGAFFAVMAWSSAVTGAKTLVDGIKLIGQTLGLTSPKVLFLVGIITLLVLIVDDFINFMVGNDSVIGSLFDNAGIGADNAREMILDAFEKVSEFVSGVFEIIGGLVEDFNSFAEGALQGFNDFVSDAGDKVESLTGFFADNKEALELLGVAIGTITALIIAYNASTIAATAASGAETAAIIALYAADGIAAIAKGALTLATTAWTVVAGAATAVTSALAAAVAFLTSPIGLVILAIGALIAIGVLLYNHWDEVKEYAIGVWNSISSFFGEIVSGISQTFSDLKEKVVSTVSGISEGVVNGFNDAIDFITGLPEKALQWGADFIDGLINGIKSKIEGIKDAVGNVGENIKSFLHFSVPDEGPLTDYESWMPDFMKGLAEGISGNEDVVLDKIRNVARGISAITKAVTAAPSTVQTSTVSNRSSSVTQNVDISNTYNGGTPEEQKNISRGMKKSATDATTEMARALEFARG